MRRVFTIVLVALLLGVGIVALIETDPGYVLVAYGKYTLETSLWVGLLLVALSLVLVYLVFRLAYRLLGGQRSLLNWFGSRKTYHSRRLSTRGVISYTEGNWSRAQRQLEQGARHNDTPLLNYLLAARASDKLGDVDKVHEHLRAAGDSESRAEGAVAITLAEMKLQAGEYRQALGALEKVQRGQGRQPQALLLMWRAYEGLQDWDKVLEILPELKKHKLLSQAEHRRVQREVSCHRLEQAATDAERLRITWQHLPARLKRDAAMLETYVSHLLALDAQDTAEKVLTRALRQQWDARLVRQYGLLQGGDASRQLSVAEGWLQDNPDDAQLLLALGRLCAREKLWGKARDYLESSYRVQRSPEVCAELGRLLTGLGEPKVAAAYYREGLLASESDLPDLPMPDRVVAEGQLLTRS